MSRNSIQFGILALALVSTVVTSQDDEYGKTKMQLNEKGKLRSSIKLKGETAAAVSLFRFSIFH
jgi:hypothetical protein